MELGRSPIRIAFCTSLTGILYQWKFWSIKSHTLSFLDVINLVRSRLNYYSSEVPLQRIKTSYHPLLSSLKGKMDSVKNACFKSTNFCRVTITHVQILGWKKKMENREIGGKVVIWWKDDLNLEIELNLIIKVPELGWRRGWDPKVVESFDAIQGWTVYQKWVLLCRKGEFTLQVSFNRVGCTTSLNQAKTVENKRRSRPNTYIHVSMQVLLIIRAA